jgi:hypothetical protein
MGSNGTGIETTSRGLLQSLRMADIWYIGLVADPLEYGHRNDKLDRSAPSTRRSCTVLRRGHPLDSHGATIMALTVIPPKVYSREMAWFVTASALHCFQHPELSQHGNGSIVPYCISESFGIGWSLEHHRLGPILLRFMYIIYLFSFTFRVSH